MIQRIFHPIGQGAFYTENHDGLNIVYDCGEWKNSKLSDKVIKQSFNAVDNIDILFISHFDYDHISKIPLLKKHVNNIRKIVLPLLHDNEKILLTNIYNALGLDFTTLINNPESYFNGTDKIVYVRASEDDGQNEALLNKNIEPLNIDNIESGSDGKRIIESGTSLTLTGLKNWVFIPYNWEYKNRNEDLVSRLENKFDIAKLQSDPLYTLSIIKNTQKRKIIRDIYDELNGKINQNSMLLYSGPIVDYNGYKRIYHKSPCSLTSCHYYDFPWIPEKVACIYTGDSDLNVTNVNNIFSYYWKHIGTIQIPHHGDIKAFQNDVLNNNYYCCPISYGTNNTYGHPSTAVISNILSQSSYPIMVTEDIHSLYIEIINSNDI